MDFFGVKKRHPYPSAQRRYGVKAIIGFSFLLVYRVKIPDVMEGGAMAGIDM